MTLSTARPPAELLAEAFAGGGPGRAADHRVLWPDGTALRLDVERWLADPAPEELDLLAEATGPVLDVGCGPGRHVAALGSRGVEAVGIDILPPALHAARGRGATVLERSAFGDVPRAGQWATVLLLDGNIGIGGDPARLLRRVHELLAPGGSALVEVEGHGVGVQCAWGRLETPQGRSRGFTWGRVGTDAIDGLATRTGFAVADVRAMAGRSFAWLRALQSERHRGGDPARFEHVGAGS